MFLQPFMYLLCYCILFYSEKESENSAQEFGLSIMITFIKTLRNLLMMNPRIMTAQESTATMKDFGQIIATIIPSPKAEK